MFYYISGILALTTPTMAVIDCSGVGYKLTISANTLSKLAGKDGTKVKLYTYFSVREDAQELYGFFTEEEQLAFTMLISVSGVGPKAAIAILSVLTPEKLSLAISTGNAKEISKAQGLDISNVLYTNFLEKATEILLEIGCYFQENPV